MLAVPLKNHLGRTIGVIQVLNKAQGEFTDEDEAILTSLSTQAAVAIDNSRLFLSLIQKNRQLLDTKDQLERKVRDLELLFQLERGTSRAQSLDELIVQALAAAAHACEARGAAMLSYNEETGESFHYVHDSEANGALERFVMPRGQGFLSAAMDARDIVNVTAARSDPRYSERVEGRYSFGVDSVLALGLGEEPDRLGALAVLSKRTAREFSPADESLLRLICANITTAVRLFRANEERERSARLTSIGRLLSQVIHDFKTPMTLISGYVQLMQKSEDPLVRADFGAKILKQFDVLAGMQREVLEFARGERSIFVRKVYLNAFFGELAEQLRQEIGTRPIELKMDVDTKVVARFDENRVARAIQNLARNALEAMGQEAGVLNIAARMDGEDLFIAISDTGPGIPEEIRSRLFQSFVTAGKKGGTGLGLAIVKKIVEEHGGWIEAENRRTGGARVRVTLPLNERARAHATRDPRKNELRRERA
jgi:signal transduction histidine kinase